MIARLAVLTVLLGAVSAAEVVVEFTTPAVVDDNLAAWRAAGVNAVVGTSGFDPARLEALRRAWGSGPPNCLVVPNFSNPVGSLMPDEHKSRLVELLSKAGL